jgi:hypothetical protein
MLLTFDIKWPGAQPGSDVSMRSEQLLSTLTTARASPRGAVDDPPPAASDAAGAEAAGAGAGGGGVAGPGSPPSAGTGGSPAPSGRVKLPQLAKKFSPPPGPAPRSRLPSSGARCGAGRSAWAEARANRGGRLAGGRRGVTGVAAAPEQRGACGQGAGGQYRDVPPHGRHGQAQAQEAQRCGRRRGR